MLNGLLIASNSIISLCYFIIAFLILRPFLRGEQKTSLVLATILVFFSCALGHGGHVLMMALSNTAHSALLLKLQIVVDSMTACIAITYIALRRYFSFLVDGPLLLNKTQEKLKLANTELHNLNTKLESLVLQRTLELSRANEELEAKASERKDMIAQLNRSNAFLKAQQEAGRDGIIVVDENMQILFYNQNFYQIWNLPEEVAREGDHQKMLTLAIAQMVDEQEFIDKVNYLYQNPEVTTHDELLMKDGRIIDRYTAPIYTQDIYYGRIFFFRDITKRKTMEEELRHAKDFLKLIINVMPQYICWKDCNSVYLGCNDKFALMAGVKQPQEIIGKTDYDMMWKKEEADFFRTCDKEVMETNQAQLHIIEPVYQASGKQTWAETSKIPLHDLEGKVTGVLVVFDDITARKKASDALIASESLLKQKTVELEATLSELKQAQSQLIQSEKMSALGQLVAGIAHEINNPVNFIYGNIPHIKEYVEDLISLLQTYKEECSQPSEKLLSQLEEMDCDYLLEDLPKLLSSMRIGAERIREIVLSLRSFSRLDEAAMKAVDIHEGIDSTILIIQNRLKNQLGTKIQVIKSYSNLPHVECYAGQLNQVFMNVLCNGIDALESEIDNTSPTIEIRTFLKEDTQPEEKRVVITITDNGSGIPEFVQANIFNPFFTTKVVGKGTGLGLSISYQIVVEKHKGVFTFSSVPGRTEFWIEIPLVQEQSK